MITETKFFDPDWYGWQHPDWQEHYETPSNHYAGVGRFANFDPSPMVDMVRFGDVVGHRIPPEQRLEAIRKGFRSIALGVYEGWSDLERAQKDFIDAICLTRLRDDRAMSRRKNLVFLQTGPQSTHREWYTDARRSWDLVVNYYNVNGFEQGFGDAVFFQAGTKFTAVHMLLTRYPEVFRGYDYVLLLDDDIRVSMGGLDALFLACKQRALDLAQMALSDRSHCVWEFAYARGRTGLRYVSSVEIMMPVLSRRAMAICGPDFRQSVSGFGLDLLFGKKVASIDCSNVAIIDDIVVDHLKPVDDVSGGYYSYLRSMHINPKAELRRLISQADLEKGIHECRSTFR
jgi:hypothetical protein